MQTHLGTQINHEALVGQTEAVYVSPFTRPFRAWYIFILVMLFVLFQFVLQLTSGEIVAGLMHSFALSALGAGVLSSSYYYIYTLMQTPAGMIIDSIGPRKALSVGSVICALGCAIFAFAPNTLLAFIGRILMGAGTSCAFVGALYVAMNWFPVRMFGFMVGLAETIAMVSSLLGGVFVAKTVEISGWRATIAVSAIIALVIGALIALFVKDKTKRQTMVTASNPEHHFWQEFLLLIKKPVAWINGLYIGFIFSFVTVFAALWGVPFFEVSHHWSLMQATIVADLIFLGIAFGGPIMGWLDNHIRHRRWLLSAAGVLVALLACAVIFLPKLPMSVVMVLMFLTGVIASVYVIAYKVASEIASPLVRSTSVGFANTLCVLSEIGR